MKKALLVGFFTLSLSTSLLAQQNHNLGLVSSMPLPMKVLIQHPEKLNISDTQSDAISSIMQKVPPKIHAMFDEAEMLEEAIKKALLKEAKSKTQLKTQLDKLEKIKREITDLQIDTINSLRSILSPEQFKKMLQMQKKMQQQKHAHKH